MISSIDVESFRGIKNFKLENLSQINILTGNNNCGKTSILEILDSFGQPDDFRRWRSLLRKEKQVSMHPYSDISYYEGFYDLFDINSEKKYLKYAIQEEGKLTEVALAADIAEEEITEEKYSEMMGMIPLSSEQETASDIVHQVSRLDMEIVIGGEGQAAISIYDAQRRFQLPFKRKEKYTKNIIYISPISHTEGNMYLSQVLDNPILFEEILGILKEYDEDIVSINYDSNSKTKQRGYKILSKSHRKALPLNVYGDGMKKAIILVSAVVEARDGVLLLDEFETAIHTSAMDKTFRWILETCKKLNVQVFMTSHSKEAIDKVLKCSPDLLGDIAVYTMYKEDEEISVRRLAGKKAVEVQDEMGLELR